MTFFGCSDFTGVMQTQSDGTQISRRNEESFTPLSWLLGAYQNPTARVSLNTILVPPNFLQILPALPFLGLFQEQCENLLL